MKHELIITKDGSHTIFIPEMNVTYHSVHGAIQESQHVFIKAGLIDPGLFDFIGLHHVLEIGFGTGLNALLTLIEADRHKNRIYYNAIELFPLNDDEISRLNYCDQLNLPDYKPLFDKMHHTGWEEMYEITNYFRLTKIKCDLLDYSAEELFDIIYFDAFAPASQPELWTIEVFEKMFSILKSGGMLVTYCSKGEVRRNMIAAGFKVEKLPGPPGKREMIRAIRPQPTS